MNNNNRRRNFRPRPQKNNFRRRPGSLNSNSSSGLQNNGNMSFSRNGSMTNIHNVEKTMQKYQQLAKDAQSMGDPVLVENYLQHVDHFSRRLSELNTRVKPNTESNVVEKSSADETSQSEISKKAELETDKNI